MRTLSFAALLAAATVHADVVTVGAGSDCDHHHIQAAINATAFGTADEIRIANDQGYTSQTLTKTDNGSLHIIGGFERCSSTVPVSISVLDGSGAARPVLSVSDGDIELRNLHFTGASTASATSFAGGGLLVTQPTREVGLYNIAAYGNAASYGGGIAIVGGRLSRIHVHGGNVRVDRNKAWQNGGGWYMLEAWGRVDNLSATKNIAGTSGGGMFIGNNGYLEVGVRGGMPAGAYANSAKVRGGGISLEQGGQFWIIHAKSSAKPGEVSANYALTGGGVYVGNDRPERASVFISMGANFLANRAEEGAAFAADANGSDVERVYSQISIHGAAHSEYVPCAEVLNCDLVSGNLAALGDRTPGAGAVARLNSIGNAAATLSIGSATINANEGIDLIRADAESGPDWNVAIWNTLIHGNTVDRYLVDARQFSMVFLMQSTFGSNRLAGAVTHVDDTLWLRDSVFTDSAPVLGAMPIFSEFSRLLVPWTQTELGNDEIRVGNAHFVDESNADFRLRIGSPAIDLAPDSPADWLDRGGRPRSVKIYNGITPRDIGAFERQLNDP